jgi:hypothetical protein
MPKKKTIYITSFKESVAPIFGDRKFSVAVYQPVGFAYPKLEWADIRDSSGRWIMPRNFIGYKEPLEHYVRHLWRLYQTRAADIYAWSKVARTGDVLCCWCPYEQAAQRQIREHGSFVCHTSVVGLYLNHVMRMNIVYDDDRTKLMWKPKIEMVIGKNAV